MLRKSLAVLILLLLLMPSCPAETVRIGQTQCLLQPPAVEDRMKRYVLFVGAAEYYMALSLCADVTADDGTLLIPQADMKYEPCSAASDRIIEDLKGKILSWAEAGCEIILTGYSAGGYPATALAVYLADAGYTGTLYILDGIYGDYRGIVYNADYYRAHLSAWQVTICASSALKFRIAERTRNVGEALSGDDFVTYLAYDIPHEELQDYYRVIFNGEEFIHGDALISVSPPDREEAETDTARDSTP